MRISFHSNRNFWLSAIFLLSVPVFAQDNPTHFKTNLDFGGGTVISTFLDVDFKGDQYTIKSPRNADFRIVGRTKARLGRLMGKLPKKGSIVTITGTRKKDSLFGDSKMPMFGKLTFAGLIQNGTLNGALRKADGTSVGTLQGVVSNEHKMDYSALYPQLVRTVEDNIYSRQVLQTKAWKQFDKKLQRLCIDARDDIEMFFGFNMLAQKLPFTHLSLTIGDNDWDDDANAATDTPLTPKQAVFFEEKNAGTAYLKIVNFSSSSKELSETLPKIVNNPNYKNLIIDLRDNGGGGIDAAFALAKYIVTEDLEVGYFPTNKLSYSGFDSQSFAALPELQPKSTHEFGMELRRTPGVKLIFKKPENQVFTGRLYVLTNGNTGSTCEPIVYALKSSKKATIVGETTYGGMLSASPFTVSGKYVLILPVGDFYTHDGQRLDKVGVTPDVAVKSSDALAKALEIINGKS